MSHREECINASGSASRTELLIGACSAVWQPWTLPLGKWVWTDTLKKVFFF